MDPTNLLLILALDSPHCLTRHQAQYHLEKQGMAAMVTLLTFEKGSSIEVSRSCRMIKERVIGRYVLEWAEGQKFYALSYGHLNVDHGIFAQYFGMADRLSRPEYNQSCYARYRHATRLWAIDRILSGESWKKVADELVGEDGLPDENTPEEPCK